MSDDAAARAERDRGDALAVHRIACGDSKAVGELYDRYGKTALGLALKIVRDEAEAEDVVHDAFVAIVQRADQYHPERGTVAAWLVTTVRNLALDRARRRTRRARIAESDLKHEVRDAPASPEAQLAGARDRSRVRAAMRRLPAAQRETLEIAFFEGLSYPEIAERENVPLGTVKSRAARALSALRDALASEDAR
ncbi:MAG TPA: sigma-70 family RNA polymerase sigma factor [Polyangiaceae bacterium]|jgi:RNA polymerase sigma-70 factor (ECF subfamily)|nr:sigma-70 family RNA polymerase sigma factor [Polyangiaceae bacterium]